MKQTTFFLQLLMMLLCAASSQAKAIEDLQIVRVNPSGQDVPAERQLVFQFNRDVVAIGQMQRKREQIPITITPPLNCNWRWLDRSALACQLNEKDALVKATEYTLTVWPGIKDQQGQTLKQPFVHRFTTQRPKINRIWFKTWEAPGVPVLRAVFNQPVALSSVQQHVFFSHQQQRYALKALKDPDDKEAPIVKNQHTYRRIWLLKPVAQLALDSQVAIQVEPGLQSAMGSAESTTTRTVLSFDTFPVFAFNGIYCRNNQDQEILITSANRDRAKCNPLSQVALNFSTPVVNSEIRKSIEFIPDLAGGRIDYDPWANHQDYSRLQRAHKKGQSYNVWLPEMLKAAQRYQVESLPGVKIHDEFARTIQMPIELWFLTDHRLPDFSLGHHYSVLEQSVASELPIYVTNLEQLIVNYKALTLQGTSPLLQVETAVEPVADLSFAKPLGVREMLYGQSGVLYGRITTLPTVKKSAYERNFFSQVSPFQVHVKLGHFNSLVWVTDFATGLPVSNAKITIYKDALTNLSDQQPILAEARTDAQGIAVLTGTQQLDPDLKTFGWRCAKDDCQRLMVRVDKLGQMALLPINNHFQVNTYRASGYSVYASQRKQYGHIHSWGTTAQGVYKAGDTMQYKLYVRDQNNKRFTVAPNQGYQLQIIDPSGKPVHIEKDIKLSEFGGYHGEYKIPETAIVGWYQFRLKAAFSDYDWKPMRVLVSDFTPSPFKVTNELNGKLFHPDHTLEITTEAKLHSGGPYTNAPIKVTVNLQSRYFTSDHPLAKGYHFNNFQKQENKMLLQQTQQLDYQGQNQQQLKLPESSVVYGQLNVESSVKDDRGKSIATRSRAKYLAVDRLVGMKSSAWVFDAGVAADINYLVVDAQGQPSENSQVDIDIEYEETVSARVKGAGNAYLTQYKTQWKAVANCFGQSTLIPKTCQFNPEQAGTYRLTASTKDTHGNIHTSQINIWVAGKGQVIWRQPDNHSLTIIPEQTEYKVGDTARYLVKNPYPGAQALITLERYGVVKQWQQKLEDSTAMIEFPIEQDLLPGFYLSILVSSPRVAQPLGDGQVDLGKPTFKIGYVKVPVKDPWKEIKVGVKVDQSVYKPGDEVIAHIQAKVKHSQQQEPIELAVVVLDEAVLDLIRGGEKYFDPYRGFYHLDGLDLNNYSLLTRLIGRQKFEKKGANAGGDGGKSLTMRDLFKYVSYWNPALQVDTEGQAEINFKLPDNLTGWRVIVMAVTPTDRMGLGDTNFKVNQNTEIRPVMPNQVLEGDHFQAGFSIMNRSDKERQIKVNITVLGDVSDFQAVSKTIRLKPYQRETVFAPVHAATLALDTTKSKGEIRFKVAASDSSDADALEFQLPVLKQRVLLTAADYGSTTAGSVEESVLIPAAIYPDVGTIGVLLSSTVMGNLDGAFKYMRDYPYACWEQKLSKAVMAAHFIELQPWLDKQLHWQQSRGLPKQILSLAANYQAPNGGMAYYIAQNKYVSPYLSAYTALAFNWLRDSGYTVPGQVEKRLHTYLLALLRKNTLPDFYNKGMASTVRAVALAALGAQGKIDAGEIARYQPHFPYMSLFGKAQFLMAAMSVEAGPDSINEITDAILAQAQQSGGTYTFNEAVDDSYQRILATPLRANCALLSAFSKAKDFSLPELPFKLVRSITQSRGKRDHWENTQENMFCMNAMIDYSRRYETEPPKMSVNVSLGQQRLGFAEFTDYQDQVVWLSTAIPESAIGQEQTLTIRRIGRGRLYHVTRLQYALQDPPNGRDNAGMDIRREYSVKRNGAWQLLETEADPRAIVNIKRGELVRVDIYLSLPTARNFVVVDDPSPGGLEPVNRDLATTSELDADAGKFNVTGGSWWLQYDDWRAYDSSRWSFYHQEIKHDRVRFYSDYLPAGRYHLSYTAQAIAVGEFTRMPVFAETMYDPDVFGRGRTGRLVVGEVEE